MFDNGALLITGGTGSFGHAALRRFLRTDVPEIRIFSRDEKKQDDMRRAFNDSRLRFYVGDVRDYSSVKNAMSGADFVFHAAALKQVPSCEFYPLEAVKTNILGTDNVLEAAVSLGIDRVVCLSTDKAVYPINAMGISKAMMEKLVVARCRAQIGNESVMCITRYGNVMASRGSVIPLLVDQLFSGKALTITDPRMTRFMMSLDEAVDLVVYAFEHGSAGDVFVQKAPASTLETLVAALLDLFGKVGHPVDVIGTRHGEKEFETLLSREEIARAEDLGAYYRVMPDTRDLHYGKFFDEGEMNITNSADYTSHNAQRLDVAGMKELLLNLDYIRDLMAGKPARPVA